VIDATTWSLLQSQTAAPAEPTVDTGGAGDAGGPDDQAPEPAPGEPATVDAGGDSAGAQEGEGFF
jgi:hypothetical protein